MLSGPKHTLSRSGAADATTPPPFETRGRSPCGARPCTPLRVLVGPERLRCREPRPGTESGSSRWPNVFEASLLVAAGWLLTQAEARSLLVDLAFLIVGGVLVLANPLTTLGIDLPWFGDLGLYATIGTGTLLRLIEPVVAVLGVCAIGARI